MKKFLLATALGSLCICKAFAAAPHDVDMGEAAPGQATSAFDISTLQAAIHEIAYTKNSTLTYEDFVKDMFRRYSALQADITRLRLANPTTDFSAAITEINKVMTATVSSEDMLTVNYIITTKKISSEEDITPEMANALINFVKTIIPEEMRPQFNIALSNPMLMQFATPIIRSCLYNFIKAKQKSREVFYSMLLTKPQLKAEYDMILRGQKLDLSEEFFQELKNSDIKLIQETLNATLNDTFGLQGVQSFSTVLSQAEAEIVKDLSDKRPALPLLIKHFGDTGLGII